MTSNDTDLAFSPTLATPAENGGTKDPLPPTVSCDQQFSPVNVYVKRSFVS